MKLEELKVYQIAMNVGDTCWILVAKWNYFEKDTIGKQLVRASDSIAVNISEGFGRYHFKENRYFNFIARGSLFETKTWLDKAVKRNLISEEDFSRLKIEMNELGKMLNGYIKKIGSDNVLKEPDATYLTKVIPDDDPILISSFLNFDDLPFPMTNDPFPFSNDFFL